MPEFISRKSFLLTILIAAAIAACFVISRHGATPAEPPAGSASTADTAVKGSQVTALPAKTIAYTKAESLNHLDLTAANVIWYTNYYRTQNNRTPLSSSAKLSASAKAKNTSMADHHYFDHTQPGTSNSFDTFIEAQNYDYIKVGENLAKGDFRTSYEVVNAWMNSPAHRQNILDSAYTNIGVNVRSVTEGGREVVLVTQHFGKPRNSCPTIDASIKSSIERLKASIKGLKVDADGAQGNTEAYNTLVETYNNSVSHMSELVDEYNQQVRAFDACIGAKK